MGQTGGIVSDPAVVGFVSEDEERKGKRVSLKTTCRDVKTRCVLMSRH
jgi:hypothetical protein